MQPRMVLNLCLLIPLPMCWKVMHEHHCMVLGFKPRASRAPGKHPAHGAAPALLLAAPGSLTSLTCRHGCISLTAGGSSLFALHPQGPLPLSSPFLLPFCVVACPLGQALLLQGGVRFTVGSQPHPGWWHVSGGHMGFGAGSRASLGSVHHVTSLCPHPV